MARSRLDEQFPEAVAGQARQMVSQITRETTELRAMVKDRERLTSDLERVRRDADKKVSTAVRTGKHAAVEAIERGCRRLEHTLNNNLAALDKVIARSEKRIEALEDKFRRLTGRGSAEYC